MWSSKRVNFTIFYATERAKGGLYLAIFITQNSFFNMFLLMFFYNSSEKIKLIGAIGVEKLYLMSRKQVNNASPLASPASPLVRAHYNN